MCSLNKAFHSYFIILIDLDSGKTALQNCNLKITKNNSLKSKKTFESAFV